MPNPFEFKPGANLSSGCQQLQAMARLVDLSSHLTEIRSDSADVRRAALEIRDIGERYIGLFNLSEVVLQIAEQLESPPTEAGKRKPSQESRERRVLELADSLEETVLKYIPRATAGCLIDSILNGHHA